MITFIIFQVTLAIVVSLITSIAMTIRQNRIQARRDETRELLSEFFGFVENQRNLTK